MKEDKQREESIKKPASGYSPLIRILCWSLALLMGFSVIASIVGSLLI